MSLRGIAVEVVERAAPACAASGKAGGFLALDWCDGSVLGPLARRSFALHAALAERFGNPWGYRRLDTLAIATARDPGDKAGLPSWLGPRARLRGRLGDEASTAQVDPARLTQGLLDAAVANGATLRIGRVEGLVRRDEGDPVTGVVVGGEPLPADAVVLALGPWSALACRWLALPAVHALKGNSVVFRNPCRVTPHALFVETVDARGVPQSPEVFPRPDGTTYVCGLSSTAPLPADPEAVRPDDGAEAGLRALTAAFAPGLAAAEALRVQACYRPVTADGLPLIGPVPGATNAYAATGHGVWGILNAPATGEALSELVLDGATRHVDLRPFDPARLPAHVQPITSA